MKRSSTNPSTSTCLTMPIFWSTVASYFSTSSHLGLMGVERQEATAAEVEVEHLLGDGRPLLLLRRRLFGVLGDPRVGFNDGLEVGDDERGMLVEEVLTHDGTVQVGDRGLAAVEDLAAETLELHELTPRTEVRVSVDSLLLDAGGADGWALVDQREEVRAEAAVQQRLEDHAVGGGAERDRDLLALEVFELVDGRVGRHRDGVAGAVHVVTGHRDDD